MTLHFPRLLLDLSEHPRTSSSEVKPIGTCDMLTPAPRCVPEDEPSLTAHSSGGMYQVSGSLGIWLCGCRFRGQRRFTDDRPDLVG